MRWCLCSVLMMGCAIWSVPGDAAPAKRPGVVQQGPSNRPLALPGKRPGLLKRIRKSRTNPTPRVFRLLRPSFKGKQKLQWQGKFVYWRPRAPQKGPVYRIKKRNFNKKFGPLLGLGPKKPRGQMWIAARIYPPVREFVPGVKRQRTVIPCRVRRLVYNTKSPTIDVHKHRGRAFKPGSLGRWASVDLVAYPHRLSKGRLVVHLVKPSRSRARRAHFHRIFLPASVLEKYKAAAAQKKKLARYVVRFRIFKVKLYRRFPAQHWMPQPHGGFRHYEITGRP